MSWTLHDVTRAKQLANEMNDLEQKRVAHFSDMRKPLVVCLDEIERAMRGTGELDQNAQQVMFDACEALKPYAYNFRPAAPRSVPVIPEPYPLDEPGAECGVVTGEPQP
jgi:hypothetical protein